VEIVDNNTSEVHFIGRGVRVNDVDSGEDPFIDALETIQNAFPMTTFPLPEPLKRGEMQEVFDVAEIVRSGQTTRAMMRISFEANAETITNVLRYVDKDGIVQHIDENGVAHIPHMHIEQEHTPHTLLGVLLDLGPSRVDFPPVKLAHRPKIWRNQVARLAPDGRAPLVLVPVDPTNNIVRYHYKRYEPNRQSNVANVTDIEPPTRSDNDDALDSVRRSRLKALIELRDNGERPLTASERVELDQLIAVMARVIIDTGVRDIAQRQKVSIEAARKEVMDAANRSAEQWAFLSADPTRMAEAVNEAQARRRERDH